MPKLKTYSAKPSEVARQWYIVDASMAPLGRIATVVATRLIGKHKPSYTAHIDVGDSVVIINASRLQLTGDKLSQKQYYRHSGYPGAIKSATAEQMLEKNPIKVIELAVKGMLPKNKLQAARMARLKVYAGAKHEHEAQQPQVLEVGRGN